MQPIPTGHPIAEVSGPIIVACLLNWGLFGTLSVQLYDRRSLKYLVYGIYIIEFVQTMVVARDTFVTFGYSFGDVEALTRMNYSWLTVPIMSAVAAGVGHVFYAYRIFILSKSRILPIFVICVSLISSVAAVITGIYAFHAGNVIKLNNRKTSIAIGLMRKHYQFPSHPNADHKDNSSHYRNGIYDRRLTPLTLAVVALLNVILFFVFPHQTFYMTPALLMPKLYTNTVYMVLNSRMRIIGGRDTYMSSNDMSITTTMIRDITSQSGDWDARTGASSHHI
ncbi:hypothetical protein EV421DRAFT_1996530 [Armillaria borealis]|uniref:Uncharacterized protein n=1 Tax=Armillaria borealis TaxID=47425 RepID=A0AA39MWC2_9AGAR|nr:hypothetical protein EV421DRAFT_1996530 [Armillaria borealis]